MGARRRGARRYRCRARPARARPAGSGFHYSPSDAHRSHSADARGARLQSGQDCREFRDLHYLNALPAPSMGASGGLGLELGQLECAASRLLPALPLLFPGTLCFVIWPWWQARARTSTSMSDDPPPLDCNEPSGDM